MTVDFALQREKMVDGQLRTTGVTSFPILAIMSEVPREQFVPEHLRPFAYIDEDIPVLPNEAGVRRYLMEPSSLARLIQLADIGPQDSVLEIGCATGYSTAVISRIAAKVVAVESDANLAEAAQENLARLGCDNARVKHGELAEGYPAEGPYDVIFLNGAVETVPVKLFNQLAEGGRFACIVGLGNTGTATLWTKVGGELSSRRAFNAAIGLLPGFELEKTFVF